MSPQQGLRYVPLPRDWPLDRNLVPKEVAFPWHRACCRMAPPCSPSDHCGHARGGAGPYMCRDAPQLAPSGQLGMAKAPVQRQDLSLPHGLLCVLLCFLTSLDTLSVRSDLTLGGRLGGCSTIADFCISSDFLCSVPLSWFPSNLARHPTIVPTTCWGKRAPAALGLCCGCKNTLQSVCITHPLPSPHLPLFP